MKPFRLFVSISVSVASLLSSCTTNTNVYSISSYHNYRGIDYYERGRLDDSIRELKKAVETEPHSAKIHFNLGVVYYENKELDKAIVELKRALEINPRYAEAHSALGNVYMDQGNLDDAILHYRSAVEANENYADAHNNLGNAYWAMGLRNQAIVKYKDAVERNPNLDTAYVNLGYAYKEEGMLDDALKELTRAKELNPNRAEVHHYLADVYYKMGLLEDAVGEYKKCISLYGPHASPQKIALANSKMALAYYKAGEYGEAVSRFKEALEIDSKTALATVTKAATTHGASSVELQKEIASKERYLAKYHSTMGERDEALAHYRDLIAHYLRMAAIPGGAQVKGNDIKEARSRFLELFQGDKFGREAQGVYLRVGRAYLKKGNLDKALAEFERVLEVNPTHLEARLELVRVCVERKDLERAAREARKAEVLYPKDERVKILLGNIYLKRGMLDEAVAKYEEALELSPLSTTARANLGVAYVGLRRLDDAIREYLGALELNPSLPKVHMNLGRAYYRKGEIEKARLEFDRALDMNPNLAGAYKGKARIAEDMKRWEGAIALYRQALDLFGEDRHLQRAEVHDHLAAIYSKKFMTEQAVAELLRAVELRLLAIKDYDGRGLGYYNRGLFEEAFRWWGKSVKLKPALAKRYERLGDLYALAARYDRAIVVYRNAANLYRSKENRALMHYNIADMMMEKGMPEGAILEYEKAIDLNPGLAVAYTRLGLAYDKIGQLDRAVSNHKKALEIDPNLAEAHKNLGMSYHKQGLSSKAKKEFTIYNKITLKE